MVRTPVSPIFNFAPKTYCAADVILHCILGYCLLINNAASRVQKRSAIASLITSIGGLRLSTLTTLLINGVHEKVDSDQEIVV